MATEAKLFDHNGTPFLVEDGVAVPVSNKAALIGGEHETDGKFYHLRMRDDETTSTLKRVLVEASIAPGSTIQATNVQTLIIRDEELLSTLQLVLCELRKLNFMMEHSTDVHVDSEDL